MATIRPAAVAGLFYPAEADDLDAAVTAYLATETGAGPLPKAIIAPHAGYIYSGAVAASVYARLRQAHETIRRVVLVGPSHRVGFRGLAVTSASAYATPLGTVALDRDAIDGLMGLPGIIEFDAAHGPEHSLEVHLPFLQKLLDDFTLVPIVAGDASADEVAAVLAALWGGPETLIVISSDLSHFLDYDDARIIDAATTAAIEHLDPDALTHHHACGRVPVGGLLTLARKRRLRVSTVDVRNSGDTAGERSRVVGYGAWAFVEPDAVEEPFKRHAGALLRLAMTSIRYGLANGHALPVKTEDHPEELIHPGACFVTLKKGGDLRGCLGSAAAWRPLVEDVADNAFKAAFRDSRFKPLALDEVDDISLSLAVLTPPEAMIFHDEADLLRQLRPHTDGLIIRDGHHHALFLPSVWHSLPAPEDFLSNLKQKAGLFPHHWSPHFTAHRFTTVELRED